MESRRPRRGIILSTRRGRRIPSMFILKRRTLSPSLPQIPMKLIPTPLLHRARCAFVLFALAAFSSSVHAEEKDFSSLFSGTDLSGWKGDSALWSVRDGAITGQTTAEHPAKGNTFLV